jgi:peptide/nickel transport system substrate-binding protein
LASSRGAGFGGPAVPGYSRLFKEKAVTGEVKGSELVGDVAESWELSNDGLTLNVKLKPNVKFDPRPPTNSRALDADDVVFSLNKFFAQSPYASQLSYQVDPASPVQSVTKIDSRTVQYKMAFPWSPLMKTLANGNHLMLPREAESGFNPRLEIRGTGPWMMDNYQTSVVFQWKRNPNFYETTTPYLDGYDTPIITETATQLAQFQAKNIDVFTAAKAGDIIGLVGQLQGMKIYQGDQDTGITSVAFGSNQGSPFYDVRMRRAVSLAIDRELLATTESGADLYEKANIPFPLDIDSHLASAWKAGDYWLDPRDSSKWGDSGQYWKHNVAAAKQLVAAAGFPNGVDVNLQLASRAHSSPEQAAVLAAMMADAGIRLKINTVDYNTIFLPKIWVPGPVKGDYDGMTFGNSGGWQPHVVSSLYITAHTKGSYTSSRRWDDQQDKIDKMITDASKEFDENKLRQQVWDIQKAMAGYMSGVTYTYGQSPYHMVWQWVQNYRVWRNSLGAMDTGAGGTQGSWLYNWIDSTQKT